MQNSGQDLSWEGMLIFFLCIGMFVGGLIYVGITSASTPSEEVRIVDKYKDDEIFDDYFIRLSNGEVFEVSIHEYTKYSIGDWVIYHSYSGTISNNR